MVTTLKCYSNPAGTEMKRSVGVATIERWSCFQFSLWNPVNGGDNHGFRCDEGGGYTSCFTKWATDQVFTYRCAPAPFAPASKRCRRRCDQLQVQPQVRVEWVTAQLVTWSTMHCAPGTCTWFTRCTCCNQCISCTWCRTEKLMDANFSQERVVGRGCSDKGGPGQLLEGECEAFQSGERTEKYRNWKCSYQKYWNWKVLKYSPAIFNIFAIIVAPFQQDHSQHLIPLILAVTRNFSQILLLLLLFVQQTWNRSC